MPEEMKGVMNIPEAVSYFRRKSSLSLCQESLLNFIELLGRQQTSGFITEDLSLSVLYTGGTTGKTLRLFLDEKNKMLIMNLESNIYCCPERLDELAQLFTHINNGYLLGNFAFFENTHEVLYRMVTQLDRTAVSGEYLSHHLSIAFGMLDVYTPTIAALALNMDPPLDKACDEYLKMKGLKKPNQVMPVPDGKEKWMS